MDSTEAHRQSLVQKHREVDTQIIEEMRRPSPDAIQIASLKKKKLHLKEEITSMESV